MNLVQNYSDHFGNSQRSSLLPTGGVKSTFSIEKWLRKLHLQHEQHPHEQWGQQSWHKLHQQAQGRKPRHAQVAFVSTERRARSFRLSWWCNTGRRVRTLRLSWWCVIHTSLAQDVLESSFDPIFMHVWFSLTSPSSFSTSTWPSPFSSAPLSCCTLSCTPTSTTWTQCNTTCGTQRRGVTTPTTSRSPSQIPDNTRWEAAQGFVRTRPSAASWEMSWEKDSSAPASL